MSYSHLQAILEFMYAGEVNVSQEQLPAFLRTADRLKVKGLAETPAPIKREWWQSNNAESGDNDEDDAGGEKNGWWMQTENECVCMFVWCKVADTN